MHSYFANSGNFSRTEVKQDYMVEMGHFVFMGGGGGGVGGGGEVPSGKISNKCKIWIVY